MEQIIGYFTHDGTPIEDLDSCDYVQLKLLGNHAEEKNAIALVSKESLPIVLNFKWYLSKSNYPVSYRSINGNIKLGRGRHMHQIIMGTHVLNVGASKGRVVDHINRDKLDNRLGNLRICTPKENSYNTSRHNKSKPGDYKGVRRGSKNTWIATLTKDGKKYEIKDIKTKKEAAQIYDAIAEEMFGKYAGKNFG